LAKGRLDLLLAALNQVHGDPCGAPVLQDYGGVLYFTEVFRWEQSHPVDERQFRHDNPPATALSVNWANQAVKWAAGE
jgi:hypothetical protein